MNVRYMTRKADPSGTGARVVFTGSVVIDEYRSEDEILEAVAARTVKLPKASCVSISNVVRRAIAANAARGYITSDSGNVSVRNVCRGSFETVKGPWVRGENRLVPVATTLGETRAAYEGATLTNAVSGLTPKIDNVTDNTTGEEGVVAQGHLIYVAGDNLSLNPVKADEKAELLDEDERVVATGTVAHCDRMSLDCTFAAIPAEVSGRQGYLRIWTRCGLGDEYELKSVRKGILFK